MPKDDFPPRTPPTLHRCSFCGKTQDQVRRLVAGPNVYICNECILLCQEIISDDMIVAPEDNKTLTPNSHDGQEFDYILSGTMHIVIGKNDVILHPGDSVYYDSRTPHAMEAVGGEAVHFLAIVIP